VTVNEVVDLIGRVSGKALAIHRAADQKGDMRHTYADTSQAQRDLGFNPTVTLEEGLRAQCRWHQSGSGQPS
jgi:UDP-glucose 4-epimerase